MIDSDCMKELNVYRQANELLPVAELFESRINSVTEIKDAEELYKLVKQVVDLKSIEEIDDFIKLHTILRCTIRQNIRAIVKQLSYNEAQKLLLFMLDPDIMSGIMYQNVETQFQQAWIRELLIHHSVAVTKPEIKKIINKFLAKGEVDLNDIQAVEKLYGKLYLILSQNYREQAQKQNQNSA